MKLGYVILYVNDVRAAMAFHEEAFGLSRRFATEDGTYGELAAGDLVLSFARADFAGQNAGIPVAAQGSAPPQMEVAYTTPDVPAAIQRAVKAGGTLVSEPREKPWGQTVAFVRDPQGCLVEICTPMA